MLVFLIKEILIKVSTKKNKFKLNIVWPIPWLQVRQHVLGHVSGARGQMHLLAKLAQVFLGPVIFIPAQETCALCELLFEF